MRFLYQLLIQMAAALVFIATAVRGVRDRSYRDRLGERYGFTRLRFTMAPIWVHAASVGEVQAAVPLINRLLDNTEQRPVLVTTTTPTGAARVKALFAARAQHAFLPYDTTGAVKRFIRRINPHCLIIMETELWPNLLAGCVAQGMPVVLASARISLRTASRYARLRSLFADTLPKVLVAAQTPEDASRYTLLGAVAERLQVTGNIKFDMQVPPAVHHDGEALRAAWGNRPVWIAGSTHEGEEELVLQAHRAVLATHPQALLVLAPRHPQRFATVAGLLVTHGFTHVTRSSGQSVTAATQVLLLDTLGELLRFYMASDAAFVGGSLVPVGGHNLLEPAALARPVLTGPHTFNAPDVAALLAQQGGLRHVYSAAELGETVNDLLDSPDLRAQLGDAGQRVVQQNAGALQRLQQLIESHCRVGFIF